MTVKCLPQAAKENIALLHKTKTHNQKELAGIYGVSERTINRVLNEAGLATAVPRIKGEAYRAMKLLKEHGVTVDRLEAILIARNAVGIHTRKREQVAALMSARV